jgi:hypothetical protein
MSLHDAIDIALRMLFNDDADDLFSPGDLEALAELVEARRAEELGLRVIEALLLNGSANLKTQRLLDRVRDYDL